MPCIWKSLIIFCLLTLAIRSNSDAQQEVHLQRMLEVERQLLQDSLEDATRNALLMEKVVLCMEQHAYENVIQEGKRMDARILEPQARCELECMLVFAYLKTNKSADAMQHLKKSPLCENDTTLHLLRALVYLENEQFAGFRTEVEKLDSNYGKQACLIEQQPEHNEEFNANWLPGYYFSVGMPRKGIVSLVVLAVPPVLLTATIVASVPISGVLIGTYLGWRIYGSGQEAIAQAAEKRNRKAVLKKQLAGFELIQSFQKTHSMVSFPSR
jgi:hypothetical protein